jgi:hypothetical protein
MHTREPRQPASLRQCPADRNQRWVSPPQSLPLAVKSTSEDRRVKTRYLDRTWEYFGQDCICEHHREEMSELSGWRSRRDAAIEIDQRVTLAIFEVSSCCIPSHKLKICAWLEWGSMKSDARANCTLIRNVFILGRSVKYLRPLGLDCPSWIFCQHQVYPASALLAAQSLGMALDCLHRAVLAFAAKRLATLNLLNQMFNIYLSFLARQIGHHITMKLAYRSCQLQQNSCLNLLPLDSCRAVLIRPIRVPSLFSPAPWVIYFVTMLD